MLKASNRNSKLFDSVILVFFNSAISQLFRPGPWKNRRGEFPICPKGSAQNTPPGAGHVCVGGGTILLKYACADRGSLFTNSFWPGTYCGKSIGAEVFWVPVKELSSGSEMLTGRPFAKVVNPDIDQPLARRPDQPEVA